MHLLFLLLHSLAWQPLAHTLWLRSIPILLLENKSANSFSSLQPLSLFSTLPTSNYWSMALPCPGFHLPLCLFLFYALSTFLFFSSLRICLDIHQFYLKSSAEVCFKLVLSPLSVCIINSLGASSYASKCLYRLQYLCTPNSIHTVIFTFI